jgi:hypothetical protein
MGVVLDIVAHVYTAVIAAFLEAAETASVIETGIINNIGESVAC